MPTHSVFFLSKKNQPTQISKINDFSYFSPKKRINWEAIFTNVLIKKCQYFRTYLPSIFSHLSFLPIKKAKRDGVSNYLHRLSLLTRLLLFISPTETFSDIAMVGQCPIILRLSFYSLESPAKHLKSLLFRWRL